ncbi:MAG: MBL fold metallo-hydrolase [Pseudomonadales bacterium]
MSGRSPPRPRRLGAAARRWLLLASLLVPAPAYLLATTVVAGPVAAEEPGQGVQNRGAGKNNWWDALPRPAWAAFERVAEDVAWYEIYRIRPGVFAIYEPGQFEEVISYLILGDTRALLFDTGLGIGDMSAAVAAVTALPVTVINSHSHYDHVGGNHLFPGVHAGDTDFTRARSAGAPHEAVAEVVSDAWIWKPLPAGFDRAAYRIEPYRIDGFVDEGRVFDLGGRRLEVLLTPGHAPDSLCLLDRDNRLLFTGDTFYPAPLYTHTEGADFARYRDSARRLAELEPLVDYLLPGHNVPWVSSAYLKAMARAFDAVAAGSADYDVTDGLREYDFDGFSILVRDDG